MQKRRVLRTKATLDLKLETKRRKLQVWSVIEDEENQIIWDKVGGHLWPFLGSSSSYPLIQKNAVEIISY